jgi:hypothetical protein
MKLCITGLSIIFQPLIISLKQRHTAFFNNSLFFQIKTPKNGVEFK